MDAEKSPVFTQSLFREEHQKKLYRLFKDLIEVFGKRVAAAKKSDDHEEYRVWRGEVHDAEHEKRVQFSFGVSEKLRMGGLLKSVPFVEPDIALREPYEVVGEHSSRRLLLARPAMPEPVDHEMIPYSYGIFDLRQPARLLNLLKMPTERFRREVPMDLLYSREPVLVVVEQNWLTKFLPRVVTPRSELFRIFNEFARHTGELAMDGRIFSISSI